MSRSRTTSERQFLLKHTSRTSPSVLYCPPSTIASEAHAPSFAIGVHRCPSSARTPLSVAETLPSTGAPGGRLPYRAIYHRDILHYSSAEHQAKLSIRQVKLFAPASRRLGTICYGALLGKVVSTFHIGNRTSDSRQQSYNRYRDTRGWQGQLPYSRCCERCGQMMR
jgi:hypothetical protein